MHSIHPSSAVAVIGYGYWGKKIVNTLVENKDIDICVIEKNSEVVIPKNIPKTTFEALLNDAPVQRCCVVTPEETHFAVSKQLLVAGKNIFVEKPLALTKREAVFLSQLAERTNLCLYTDYIFLFDPYLLKIKSLLDKEVIGEVKKITSIRCSVGFYKPNITVFDDLAIHDLYIGRVLLSSDVTSFKVSELQKDKNTYVEGKVSYQFGNIPYSAQYSWVNPDQQRSLTVEGSNGKITWDRKNHYLLVERNDIKEKVFLDEVGESSLSLSLRTFLSLSEKESIVSRKRRYQEYITDIDMLESIREKAYSTL